MWRLVAIEPATGPSIAVADGSRYWIEFLSETRLSARADCNTCSGSYTLSGTTVTIGPLACTRAFCGEASLDTPFTQGLTDARELTLDEQLLQIKSPIDNAEVPRCNRGSRDQGSGRESVSGISRVSLGRGQASRCLRFEVRRHQMTATIGPRIAISRATASRLCVKNPATSSAARWPRTRTRRQSRTGR